MFAKTNKSFSIRSRSARQSLSDSSHLHTKRPEFFAARFAEVAEDVDGVLVDHLAQLKKRLIWLEIHIGNLLADLLGAGEDFRRLACLLFIAQRIVEFRERGLHGLHCAKRGVESLLHRLDTTRGGQHLVGRATDLEAFRRLGRVETVPLPSPLLSLCCRSVEQNSVLGSRTKHELQWR